MFKEVENRSVAKIMGFGIKKIENIVGKGEIPDSKHFFISRIIKKKKKKKKAMIPRE